MSALRGGAERRRLAGELKRLRLASGLTGSQLASELGVAQPTVSRIENGQQTASITQVMLWTKLTGAPEEQQAELAELAGDILAGPRSWEDESGSDDAQPEFRELESRTGVRSEYEPAVMPGLLQTPAYAARVLSSGPRGIPPKLAERVMNRMTRQQVLYDEGKQFRFVIPETVLLWPFGDPGDRAVAGEHREQLARVEAATSRPNVTIGILPLAPSPVWRLEGFSLYDEVADGEPEVRLEWLTRPYNITDPERVEMCRQAFANLLGASVTGDAARELISSAARLLGS